MARQHHMRITRLPLTGAKASEPLDLSRTGMPSPDTIHDDTTVLKPRPGRRYRILKTTQVENYENTPAARALHKVLLGQNRPKVSDIRAAVSQPTRPGKGAVSDNYAGKDRKAAKLSIAGAPIQQYSDVAALVASLPSEDQMVKLSIPLDPTSNRVNQEQRNVHVKGFLYAASREADNDFHLIVGCDPSAPDETYMTMEISGLPPASAPSFATLNAARTSFKSLLGAQHLPGAGYHFYQPPIPVVVEGSLFFDATHATGQAPGPPSLKPNMPTIFEVHPVTSIRLA